MTNTNFEEAFLLGIIVVIILTVFLSVAFK